MGDKGFAASPDEQHVIKPRARLLHDPAVTFEEYQYYARRTREDEKHFESPKLRWREIINRRTNNDAHQIDAGADGIVPEVNFANEKNRLQITDEEWTNASRAMRTASSGAAFYLITTDILGPYGVGFAMGKTSPTQFSFVQSGWEHRDNVLRCSPTPPKRITLT